MLVKCIAKNPLGGACLLNLCKRKTVPKMAVSLYFRTFRCYCTHFICNVFFSSPNKPKIMRSGVNVWMESNDADQPNIAKLPIVSTTFARGKYIAHILFFLSTLIWIKFEPMYSYRIKSATHEPNNNENNSGREKKLLNVACDMAEAIKHIKT